MKTNQWVSQTIEFCREIVFFLLKEAVIEEKEDQKSINSDLSKEPAEDITSFPETNNEGSGNFFEISRGSSLIKLFFFQQIRD